MFEHKPDKASTAIAVHADKTQVWWSRPLPKIKEYTSSLIRWVRERRSIVRRRPQRMNFSKREEFWSRRMLLKTLGASILLQMGAPLEQASAFILHGGAPAAPSNVIQTFQVANWANASSPGFIRLGLPFRRGDIPSGYVCQVRRAGNTVAAQFDERVAWQVTPYTNSLKFTVSHVRDATFASLETRTYQVVAVPGSWDNTGTLSTADIIANSNFQLVFNNVLACDGSVDPVNYVITDPGVNIITCTPHIADSNGGQGSNAAATATLTGGQLTALTITNTNYHQYALPVITFTGTVGAGGRLPSATVRAHTFAYNYSAMTISTNTLFNQTISGVATRVTKIASGSVAEAWTVWGMARDNISQTADLHLKGQAYVTIWKNPDGSIADIEHAIEAQLNWWQTTGKQRLSYDATYMNGATTIQSYPAVVHGYGGHWITVRMTNAVTKDLSAYRRFWMNQIPTLLYMPDRNYWVASGLAPPLDAASAVAGSIAFGTSQFQGYVYTPGASMGYPNQIDATGGSNSRGIYGPIESLAFLSQRAVDVLLARNASLTSLSVPYHFRLETNRKRVQDSGVADMANSIPSLILNGANGAPTLVSNYDFSYQGANNTGMPPPAHSYWSFNASGGFTNSYSPRPNMDPAPGATGPYWQLSPAASHASNYGSLFMYMLEGEHYYMENLIDLASNLATQNALFPSVLYASQTAWQTNAPGAPLPTTWQFFAVVNMRVAQNTRATGWALGIYGAAAGLCPDNDALGNVWPEKAALIALNQQNTRYCSLNFQYMPASQLAFGCWIDGGQGAYGAVGHWHHSFIGYGAYYNHTVTEDPDILMLANFIATLQCGLINNLPYRTIVDHTQSNPFVAAGANGGGWGPTNEFFSPAAAPAYGAPLVNSISSATNTLTCKSGILGTGSTQGWFGLQVGDAVWVGGLDGSGGQGQLIPAELNPGQAYYVYNPVDTGNATGTMQLTSDKPGDPTYPTLVIFNQNYGPNVNIFFGTNAAQMGQTPMMNRTGPGGVTLSVLVGPDNFCAIGHVVRTYAVMYGKVGAQTAYNNSVAFLSVMTADLYTNTVFGSQYFGWAFAVPANFIVADAAKVDVFRNVAANDNPKSILRKLGRAA